jgi:hypothetical protein
VHPAVANVEVFFLEQLYEAAGVVVVGVRAKSSLEHSVVPTDQPIKNGIGIPAASPVDQNPVSLESIPLRDNDAIRITQIQHIYFEPVVHHTPPYRICDSVVAIEGAVYDIGL